MPFRDVPAGAYYAQPVLWAYHAGVVNGCGADTFCPTQAISRQDLTVILYRYACLAGIADAAQSENVLSGFADAGAVSDYARAALWPGPWKTALPTAGTIIASIRGARRRAPSARRSCGALSASILSLNTALSCACCIPHSRNCGAAPERSLRGGFSAAKQLKNRKI